MIFIFPPQFGQRSGSVSQTFFATGKETDLDLFETPAGL
jgi:hypothetical protein